VGGLPETLGLKLLEPLRDLFKDEVRELGVALGLPHEMVYRHPFPGPGLGVRILGEVKREYADLLRRADAIFIEELRAFEDRHRQELVRPDQPGLRRVPAGQERGRDGRRPHLRLRGGAARGADQRLHDRRLGRAALCAAEEGASSSRIINEVRGINRVTYDV
jgi:GMP synthase (glutamine-hydrolysing)